MNIFLFYLKNFKMHFIETAHLAPMFGSEFAEFNCESCNLHISEVFSFLQLQLQFQKSETAGKRKPVQQAVILQIRSPPTLSFGRNPKPTELLSPAPPPREPTKLISRRPPAPPLLKPYSLHHQYLPESTHRRRRG